VAHFDSIQRKSDGIIIICYNTDHMKYQDQIKQTTPGTHLITVSIPWEEIETAKKKALGELQKTSEIQGFRKGKAPLKVVEEKMGDQKLLEEATKILLSDLYKELIKKHQLKPFLEPKITLSKAPVKGSWEIKFEIADTPMISKLPDYRKIALNVKNENKKEDIWTPGKEVEKKPDKEQDKTKSIRLQKIFDQLITQTEIIISSLIIEAEVNRRLVNLHDEVKQLGLTIDQYLQAKKQTKESIKEKSTQEVIDLYKSELILDKIAEQEKITVDEKELDKVYASAKTEKDKLAMKQNSYLYLRLLRKQKTLDFLADL